MVAVAVVDVREMWVTVCERLVAVGVGMRITGRIIRSMGMLVMRVVAVWVRVPERRVCVVVHVALREMQPDAERHEPTSHE